MGLSAMQLIFSILGIFVVMKMW